MKYSMIVLLLLALTAMPAVAKDGTDTVMLSNIYGVTQTGQPAPSATPACYKKFGDLLGTKVSVRYQINPKDYMMIAYADVLGTEVTLHPLGLSSMYAFMSDGVPDALKKRSIERVIFDLSLSFDNPRVLLLGDLGYDTTDNCVINNAYD